MVEPEHTGMLYCDLLISYKTLAVNKYAVACLQFCTRRMTKQIRKCVTWKSYTIMELHVLVVNCNFQPFEA